MVGGVCASVADYFGVDVLLVRVAAVVLALSGGAGVAGYLALWALTPSSDRPAPADREQPLFATGTRSRRTVRVVAAVVLVVVAVSLLATLKAVLFPLVAVVALIAALVAGGRWWRGLLAAVMVLVALLTAAVVAGPHLGSRTVAVTRAGDIGSAYGAPTGKVHVDLRGLVLDRDRQTAIWVGSGDVEVDVPAGLPVHVEARTGAGRVTVFDRTAAGPGASVISDSGPATPGQPRLEIDATAGSGKVLVRSVA
jgi:phage shock protein PspC (stress-responsive transcriptional regulator)